MAKACLSCGTVNPSNASFCSRCGKALSSKGATGRSRTQAGRGTEKSMFCRKCNRQMQVKGRDYRYLEPDSPVELNLVEWECAILACNHIIPIRKTGRTKNDLTSL
jgi:ribosomal protein L40E